MSEVLQQILNSIAKQPAPRGPLDRETNETAIKLSVDQRESLEHFLESATALSEIEIRFGLVSPYGFRAGISAEAKNGVYQILTGVYGNVLDEKFLKDKVSIYEEPRKEGNKTFIDIYRKIEREGLDEPIWEKKSKDFSVSMEKLVNKNWGFKISHSREEKVENRVPSKPPKMVRQRKRHSFTTDDSTSHFYGFKVDLSEIISEHTSYELEIELIIPTVKKFYMNKKTIKEEFFTNLEKVIGDLIVFVQSQNEHAVDEEGNLQMVKTKFLIPEKERQAVIDGIGEISAIFSKQKISANVGTVDPKFYNKPTNIKIDHFAFEKNMWYLTLKNDGKRALLYFIEKGAYIVSPGKFILKISDSKADFTNYPVLLEVEKVGFELHVFDCLQLGGIQVKLPFAERMFNFSQNFYDLNKIVSFDKQKNPTRYTLIKKKFYSYGNIPPIYSESKIYVPAEMPSIDDFSATFNTCLDIYKEDPDKYDGVIFQSVGPYVSGYNSASNKTFKWKPADKLSIDFLAKFSEEKNGYLLYVGKNSLFTGTEEYPYDKIFKYQDLDLDGQVVELTWDGSQFKFLRKREDKEFPNSLKTAISVWEDMRAPFTPGKMVQDFSIMRKFHNKVKKNLLEKYVQPGEDLIDLGSGRGADVLKWIKQRLANVLAVEPDPDVKKEKHIPILEKRIKDAASEYTKIHVLHAGGEDTKKIKIAIREHGMKPSAMSAFFCLTFFDQESDEYQNLLQTIADLIPDGGYFIGTIMDSALFEENIGKNYKSKNMTIKKIKGNKISITLDKTMVDYEEHLFDYETLKVDLAAMNFKEVESKILDDSYDPWVFKNLGKDAKLFSRMNRTFAFKKVAKQHGNGQLLSYSTEPFQNKIDNIMYTRLISLNIKFDFLAAVNFCMSKKMRDAAERQDQAEMKKYLDSAIKAFKKAFDENVDVFLQSPYGKVKVKNYMQKGLVEKAAQKFAVLDYKKDIESAGKILTEASMQYLLSDFLDVNIILVDAFGNMIQKFTSPEIDENKGYIFLAVIEGEYHPLSVDDKYVFNIDDPITQICFPVVVIEDE